MKHFFFFALISLFLASCAVFEQEIEPPAPETVGGGIVGQGEYATVRFSLANGAARAVLPQYDVTAFFYQLTYYRIGDDETGITYQKDGKTIFDYDAFTAADTTLTLLTGNYCFLVDAFDSATKTTRVLSYRGEVAVTADTTTLSFTLTEATGEGAATTGSVNVTLSYPTGSVVSVTARLCALSDLDTPVDTKTLTPAANDDGTSTAVYAASGILSGTYVLFVTLTDSLGSETVIPELVVVARGVASTNAENPILLDETQTNTSYVLFVGGDGASDDNDGRLPTSAFVTLQKAIDTIAAYPFGSKAWTILVSGTVRGATTISTLSAKSITISGRTGATSDVLDGNAEGSTLKISAAVPVTLKNVKITGGSAEYGGGLYLGSDVTISDGMVITGNTATKNGGGIYVNAGTAKLGDGAKIQNNTATNYGGGVYSKGLLTVSGSALISGNAAERGAGMYNDSGTFTMTGGTISENIASVAGGGVYNITGGTFTMSGTALIDGNKSKGSSLGGGGIYVPGGTVTIEGGTVSNNEATADGGGIYTALSSELIIQGGIIKGNTAGRHGGGVYFDSSSGKFTMSGGTISGNKADTNGGGVCINSGAMFMYGDAIIGSTRTIHAANNGSYSNRTEASGFGGGIYNGGKLYLGYSAYTSETDNTPATLTGGVSWNYASNGGGIYALGGSKTVIASGTISLNGTDGYGGGIYTLGTAQVTMTGGTFSKNHAGINGGGIYKSGNGTGNLFKMTGGLVTENTSGGKGSGIDHYNGDFHIGGTAQVAQDNLLFIDFGTSSDPKLYVTSKLTESAVATIALADSWYIVGRKILYLASGANTSLADEHAKFVMADDTNGGKWRVDENGKLAECPTFHVSASGDDSTGNGTSASPFATLAKAISSITESEPYTIYVSGTVTGTTAISTLTAASLTIVGKTGLDADGNPQDALDGNSAGTVLSLDTDVVVTLRNLTLQNGVAESGGGIFKQGTGSLTVTTCTITDCTATKLGGGLYVDGGCAVTLNGGSLITNCKTTTSDLTTGGGGINKAGTGSLTITACTITGCNASNKGGGLYVSGAGEVTLNGGSLITNCKQTGGGGGIGGGAICIHAASATSATVTLDDASLTNCSTAVSGGGVYMKTGSLTLKNGSISGNTASGNSMSSGGNDGGGVYVNVGTFTMTGGEISGNSAVNGGGVYNAGTFTMSGGTISGNTATESGGGVYVGNNGRFTMTGGIISDACYPANLF